MTHTPTSLHGALHAIKEITEQRDELLEALKAIVSDHQYLTPAGTMNCRWCDNNMDHGGTFRVACADDCKVHQARAAIAKATGADQ